MFMVCAWPGHHMQAPVEYRQYYIHPGFKIHGQSQLKSETESTSVSQYDDIITTTL